MHHPTSDQEAEAWITALEQETGTSRLQLAQLLAAKGQGMAYHPLMGGAPGDEPGQSRALAPGGGACPRQGSLRVALLLIEAFPAYWPYREGNAAFSRLGCADGICLRRLRSQSGETVFFSFCVREERDADCIAECADNARCASEALASLYPREYVGHICINASGAPLPGGSDWEVEPFGDGRACRVWMALGGGLEESADFIRSAVSAMLRLTRAPLR